MLKRRFAGASWLVRLYALFGAVYFVVRVETTIVGYEWQNAPPEEDTVGGRSPPGGGGGSGGGHFWFGGFHGGK